MFFGVSFWLRVTKNTSVAGVPAMPNHTLDVPGASGIDSSEGSGSVGPLNRIALGYPWGERGWMICVAIIVMVFGPFSQRGPGFC